MTEDENPWLVDPWREPPRTPEERRQHDEARRITDERKTVAGAEELLTDLAVLDDGQAVADAMAWMQHGHGAFGHPLDDCWDFLPDALDDEDEDDERG